MAKARRKTERITILVDKLGLRAISLRRKQLGLTLSEYLRGLVEKDLEVKGE